MEFLLNKDVKGFNKSEFFYIMRGRDLSEIDLYEIVPSEFIEWLDDNQIDFSIRANFVRHIHDWEDFWLDQEKKHGKPRDKLHNYAFYRRAVQSDKIHTREIKVWIEIEDPAQAMLFKLTF